MSGRDDLERRLFGAAGPDSGCDGSGDLLDAYVEAVLAGHDAAARYPDVAGHLAACPDCSQDRDALLALMATDREAAPGA
jgi:hypothetical protein